MTASFFTVFRISKFAPLRFAMGIWYHIRVSARWAKVHLDGANRFPAQDVALVATVSCGHGNASSESVRSLTRKDATKMALPVRAVSPPSFVSFKVFSHTSLDAAEEVSYSRAKSDV